MYLCLCTSDCVLVFVYLGLCTCVVYLFCVPVCCVSVCCVPVCCVSLYRVSACCVPVCCAPVCCVPTFVHLCLCTYVVHLCFAPVCCVSVLCTCVVYLYAVAPWCCVPVFVYIGLCTLCDVVPVCLVYLPGLRTCWLFTCLLLYLLCWCTCVRYFVVVYPVVLGNLVFVTWWWVCTCVGWCTFSYCPYPCVLCTL